MQYWVVGQQAAGMIGRMNLEDTWWTILQGVDTECTAEEVEALVKALVGTEFSMEIVQTDPWTARMLLAPSYGRDGIFLVGDAAHLNPPWGGHGFNTCVGDAVNLAWKLAAVIQGWGSVELINSYEQERRPIAQRMIREAAVNGKALAYDFVDPHLDDDGPQGEGARARAHDALQVKEGEFLSLGLVLGYTYAGSPLNTTDGTQPPAEDPVHYTPSVSPGAPVRGARGPRSHRRRGWPASRSRCGPWRTSRAAYARSGHGRPPVCWCALISTWLGGGTRRRPPWTPCTGPRDGRSRNRRTVRTNEAVRRQQPADPAMVPMRAPTRGLEGTGVGGHPSLKRGTVQDQFQPQKVSVCRPVL